MAGALLDSAIETARSKGQPNTPLQERTYLLDNPAPVKGIHRRATARGSHRLLRRLASRKHISDLDLDVVKHGQYRHVPGCFFLFQFGRLYTHASELYHLPLLRPHQSGFSSNAHCPLQPIHYKPGMPEVNATYT